MDGSQTHAEGDERAHDHLACVRSQDEGLEDWSPRADLDGVDGKGQYILKGGEQAHRHLYFDVSFAVYYADLYLKSRLMGGRDVNVWNEGMEVIREKAHLVGESSH